jgi:hypothetical protein
VTLSICVHQTLRGSLERWPQKPIKCLNLYLENKLLEWFVYFRKGQNFHWRWSMLTYWRNTDSESCVLFWMYEVSERWSLMEMPEECKLGSWMLHHNNISVHNVLLIFHPPCSLNWTPADSFLVSRFKNIWKGKGFQEVLAICPKNNIGI